MAPRLAARRLLAGTLAALMLACRAAPGPPASKAEPPPARVTAEEPAVGAFRRIETRIGGRLGAFVLDTQTGRELSYRADEAFALCSTFKWILAAQVLQGIERGDLSLEERIAFGPSDVLEYAPVVREHLSEGALSIEALTEAAVVLSDNTAANLLLSKVGGPAGLTAFVRSVGDVTTRLDRIEPELNSNIPGDPRDTTSPRAMVGLARSLLLGSTLSSASRERLLGWLIATPTGKNRLRAGLPADWKAGDKTGSCSHGAVNDVAVVWPPERKPILIAVYLSEGHAELAELEAAHAQVAEVVVRELEQ